MNTISRLNITQDGTDNQAAAHQTGTLFSDLTGEIEQTGSMNVAELHQSTGDGGGILTFTIRQSGDGNVTNVVQSTGP
jgi:hypothetical protein